VYKGRIINDAQTPVGLEMEQDDVIESYQEQGLPKEEELKKCIKHYRSKYYSEKNKHLQTYKKLIEGSNKLNAGQIETLMENVKRNEINESKMKTIELQLEQKNKDLDKQQVQIEELTKKNMVCILEIGKSNTNISRLNENISEKQEELYKLKADKNMLEMENAKIKESNESKIKTIEQQLEQKNKDLDKLNEDKNLIGQKKKVIGQNKS
jgi:K+ transporter